MLAKLFFLIAVFIFVAIAGFTAAINPVWGFAALAAGLFFEGIDWRAKL